MSRKKNSKNKPYKKITRERDPMPWRYCLLTLVCGAVLAGGFFFAARQHFSSMDFGMKNSKLRKQRDELEAARRQLLLNKEISLTPGEIKKAAKKIGLKDMTAANIETFPLNNENSEALNVKKTSYVKPVDTKLIAGGKIEEKKTTKETQLAKLIEPKSKKDVRERIVNRTEK
jgi:hypothetical protein